MKNLSKKLCIVLIPLTLSACGGGSGGVGAISNFIKNDVSSLSGSSTIISSYSNLLTDFQSVISSGDISAIQGVITGPNQQDINQANTLLTQLQTAKDLWDQTEQLIAAQSDNEKYTIYNSNSFKEAHAAMIYLQNYVKPVIQKVANGQTITLADYNLIDKASRANEIINHEKNSTSSDYANTKKIKSVNTVNNDKDLSSDTTGTSTVSFTEWETVNAGGGSETRNKITTTPKIRTTVTTRCTFQRTTFLNNSTSDGPQTCSVLNTTTTDLDPTVVTETETREGENPLTATIDLEPTVTTVTEVSADYTETTYTDATNTTTETDEGSSTTNTSKRDVTVTTNNGDNTSTVVVTRYVDTTVTTPITTRVYRTRHYTDTVKRDTRIVTTTVPRQQFTYKDGTTEIVNGNATVTNGNWTTTQLSESQRSENILVSETTANQVVTTSDTGTQLSSQLISNEYTNDDINLGQKTLNLSININDHKTFEYKSNKGLEIINAAYAYARGWTGKGAVLGVIDTYQDINHKELKDKYLYFKNYDLYKNTLKITQGHGTHVAGIIAGKKDRDEFFENGNLKTGVYVEDGIDLANGGVTKYKFSRNNNIHGVAYDAKLVGANVDRFSNGMISKGQAQNALQDFAKLKSPKSAGGEGLNIVAANMSFNSPQLFLNRNVSTTTMLNDGTFKAGELISKMKFDGEYINDTGSAKYYKTATDNDIIIVNSAGNYGFEHAGDPGIWATEVNSNGDLILGGKMVIVGNWDGVGVSGNKAGHVCLDINTSNNTCNDEYRISDFYILAPGNNIYSTITNNEYVSLSGTSMSAPHVTGAFGILNQMWPYMKGNNLVKLVMNTANKDLPNYNINIHGQGLLDLDEATKPQGAVGLPTSGRVDHPTISLNNTYYSTGTALHSNLSNLKIMVLDEYDRNYYMDLGYSFVVQDKRKFSDVQMLVKNKNTFLPHNQMYGSFTQGGHYDLAKNYNFGFYTGENGSGDYSLNFGKDFYFDKKFKLKTSLGHMSEQETWLGNSSDGVLAVGDNNHTTSANIGFAYQLGNNVLTLDYSKGFTDVNTTDNSLIKSFSDIETESYRMVYEIHKDIHTTFGWSFSLPSHVTSGTMDLEIAESVNLDGTINFKDISSNLKQDTKEKNIGFFYSYEPKNTFDASFNFSVEHRQDISGQDGNDGINFAMNYVKKFNGACGILFWRNPKCYNADGSKKDIKTLYASQEKEVDQLTRHGLVYNLQTDNFVPIKKK
tara:strand:+ start:847 stop:4560 length:3714 start_codon:yes stop_codon:yes gene_type:complete